MLIEEPGGMRLRRKGVAFRRTRGDGLADRLFVITAPEHLKGLALLSEDRHDKPAVQYLYVPAYRRARRVALHAAGDAYVGSSFTYADFGRVHVEAGRHRIQGTAELSGHACVVIETVTEDPNLPYTRLVSTLDRETALPLRSEYYDRNGHLTRVGSLDEIATIGGWPTPIRISMTDRRTGGRSTITLRDVQYDVGLDEDLFTVAHLEQPPPVE
jgi:hypothetical protein